MATKTGETTIEHSWRHQFRTPLKIRRKRLIENIATIKDDKLNLTQQQLENSVDTSSHFNHNDDGTVQHINKSTKWSKAPYSIAVSNESLVTKDLDIDSPCLSPQINQQSSIRNTNEARHAITKDNVKSIVTAISYIEHNNGFKTRDLYLLSSTKRIGKIKVNNDVYYHLQPFVNECIDQILHGKIHEMEHFESIFSYLSSHFTIDISNHKCNIVALAIKGVLKNCEPLIPQCFYEKVMKMKNGNEIEKLMSSAKWPDVHSMTLILLFHHLAKLQITGFHMEQHDEKKKRMYLKYNTKIAKEFGSLLLHDDENKTMDTSTQKKKKFINFPFFGKKGNKANCKPFSVHEKTDVILLILSHMCKGCNQGAASQRLLNSYQEAIYHDIDTKLTQNSGNNQVMKNHENKQHVHTKEIEINEEIPQDEVKAKDVVILKYGEDHVITRAKTRLEYAEVTLKRMEKCCSFILES